MHNTRKKTECKTFTIIVGSDLNHCANLLSIATSAGGLDEKVLTLHFFSAPLEKHFVFFVLFNKNKEKHYFILSAEGFIIIIHWKQRAHVAYKSMFPNLLTWNKDSRRIVQQKSLGERKTNFRMKPQPDKRAS